MHPHATNSTGSVALRLALIGCGALSELYYAPALRAIARSSFFSVSAIIDPSVDRLNVLGTLFPDAKRFSGIEDITQDCADIAIVASPQRFHAAQSCALLRRGLGVLCEKPMASSVEEAREMISTGHETGKLLSVGLFRRFFPSSQLVHSMIVGESLGPPISFHWTEGGPFNWPAASPSFFQKSASPGGVFADIGAHVLDLLLHWFGEPAEFDYEDDALGGLEANARLRVRFLNGVSGSVRLSRDTAIPNGTKINFEQGSVWFEGASADSVVIQLKGARHVVKGVLHDAPKSAEDGYGPPALTYAQCFMEQVRNFCRAVRGEEKLRISAEDGLRGMEWIERCYAKRRLMDMPWLTAEEIEGARRLAGELSPVRCELS